MLVCPDGEQRYINAANECDCREVSIPDAEPGGCENCGNAGWAFINQAIRDGRLVGTNVNDRASFGRVLTVYNYCGSIGVSGDAGYFWDTRCCVCRAICVDPNFPVYDAATAACVSGDVEQGCPEGQFRNAAGDCVAPPEPPAVEAPVPVVPPVAPPPVAPPPTPPCAVHRTSTDWRCVRPVPTAARTIAGVGTCSVPQTRVTPPPLLRELACQTLAAPAAPPGARLSAQVYLARNL